MNEQIVFDPKLGLTPDQFAQAWNSDPIYASQGTAQVEEAGLESMDLASTGSVIVTGIATGLLTSLTYDLIKHMFAQRRSQPQFDVQVIDQSDGTKLIVVVVENNRN